MRLCGLACVVGVHGYILSLFICGNIHEWNLFTLVFSLHVYRWIPESYGALGAFPASLQQVPSLDSNVCEDGPS